MNIPFTTLRIFKSIPGEIGPGSYWVASYSAYLHIEDSLFRLINSLIFEYKDDKHLVG